MPQLVSPSIQTSLSIVVVHHCIHVTVTQTNTDSRTYPSSLFASELPGGSPKSGEFLFQKAMGISSPISILDFYGIDEQCNGFAMAWHWTLYLSCGPWNRDMCCPSTAFLCWFHCPQPSAPLHLWVGRRFYASLGIVSLHAFAATYSTIGPCLVVYPCPMIIVTHPLCAHVPFQLKHPFWVLRSLNVINVSSSSSGWPQFHTFHAFLDHITMSLLDTFLELFFLAVPEFKCNTLFCLWMDQIIILSTCPTPFTLLLVWTLAHL